MAIFISYIRGTSFFVLLIVEINKSILVLVFNIKVKISKALQNKCSMTLYLQFSKFLTDTKMEVLCSTNIFKSEFQNKIIYFGGIFCVCYLELRFCKQIFFCVWQRMLLVWSLKRYWLQTVFCNCSKTKNILLPLVISLWMSSNFLVISKPICCFFSKRYTPKLHSFEFRKDMI